MLEDFLKLLSGLSAEASTLYLWGAAALFVLSSVLIFGWGWNTHLMMSHRRRIVLLVLRFVILLLLFGALAQIIATKFEKALSIVLLTDASQSIPKEEINKAIGIVGQVWSEKGEVPVRLLNFDYKTTEAVSQGAAPKIKAISEKPGTDIARAIHTGRDLFQKNTHNRAVLFSDGNETRGDALFEAAAAKAHGMQVDVITLKTRTDRDIYIESLNLPRKARPGERIQVSATIVSNFATQAKLILKQGKGHTQTKTLDITPGSNTYDFDAKVMSNFSTNYSAEIQAEGDDHLDNNILSAMLRVVGSPRILFFSGRPGADLSMIETLSNSRLSVRAAPIEKFPGSVAGLTPFDLVILSNVDFLVFGPKRTKTLETYLGEYGGGLLVVGGENTSHIRPEIEKKKKKRKKLPIENLLPIQFKEKKKTEPNPVALLLLMDKSASMARENKFGMAIRAAKDTIKILTDRSKVGVILFDDFPRWAIPFQSAENREAIAAELDRFGVDGGTSIYPAVKEAYITLKPLPNKVKHVILLSDGYSLSTFDNNAHLLQYMADKKITVSTVALGKESDKAHLQKIAKMGRGRFYYTEDISQIPKIFMEETKSITKTNVVENEFLPELVKRGQMLKGIDFDTMPKLFGFNSCKPKPTSEVYLLAEKKEPLLVRRRYGLGKVSFVATDSGSDWARDWPTWDSYQKFWSQIARNTLGDQNRRSYRLETRLEEDRAIVTVDALDQNGNFINDLDLKLEVSPPDGDPMDVSLKQTRPGGYSGSFGLSGYGEHSFQVHAKEKTAVKGEGIGRVFLSPPTEFISQVPNMPLLKEIAKITGGRVNPSAEQILEVPEQTFPRNVPIWPYFLYTALGLFLLSILIRRS